MNMLKYILTELHRAMSNGDSDAADYWRDRYFAECSELGRILRATMPGATFH